MAPPQQQPLPSRAPQPRHGSAFDPWNSSSTGHQRADGLGAGVPWREWRNTKLSAQYRAGKGGLKGSGAPSPGRGPIVVVEEKARVSVMDMLIQPGAMKGAISARGGKVEGGDGPEGEERKGGEGGGERSRGMFEGLVIYVNGTTQPLISDIKLKRVLAENGARMSLHLGRRRVTHVIIGRPGSVGTGAGGGLAGGKLEREIKKVGGCGIKYVGVEWVLESIKAGKRLPEARFACLKIAPSGQGSVYTTYAKAP
ncbi:uncharacterized protein DNG_00922 [Cephalotrichum gorgonifer]|uniref:BRCT domain-containing protein n=1 Tax=Cephalotrichum gorgonifer TaxID=2041049 RepID=A0AAE8SRR0_9PEZI|nr:uncharacterized protein DNG_00922 [Cephalotrichum gorgonifer]